MTEFYIHAANLGATVLTGTTGRAIELRKNKHMPETAGNLWHRLNAIKTYSSEVSLVTASAAQLLGLMPQGSAPAIPVPYTLITDAQKLTLWAIKQQDDVPLPTAAAEHEKIEIAKGLIAMRRMSWSEVGDPAILTASAWPLSANGVDSYWAMTQAAKPTMPPVDSDMTLDYVKIGTTEVDSFRDLDIEVDVPWTPTFKYPKSIYQDYLSAAGARGLFAVRFNWRSSDRALLRAYGDGYLGSAIQTVEIRLRNYANMATRGDTYYKMDLKCLVEVASAEDGRPGSVQVSCSSISEDGGNPFRWGF